MTQPNFNPGDNESEDRGYVLWNEYDWQQYLKVNDAEIVRFITLYLKHRHEPNHLDVVAKILGWDKEDWIQSGWEEENDTFTPFTWSDADEEFESLENDLQTPYTVHRHPVYIVTCGLTAHLRRVWHYFFVNFPHLVPSTLVWSLSSHMNAAHLNAIMGAQAIDMGDFSLGVCHFKHALAALNHVFRTLNLLADPIQEQAKELITNTHAVLFDLREVWLRVMQDCRAEARLDQMDDNES